MAFFDDFQPGFRPHHITESALVTVVNDLCRSTDSKDVSLPVFLDLSAALDTVGHTLLLDRLGSWMGLSGRATLV